MNWEAIGAVGEMLGAIGVVVEQEGQHDRASAVVEEIPRVRADFTVQEAIDLLAGLEREIGSAQFAQYKDALHEAGLP